MYGSVKNQFLLILDYEESPQAGPALVPCWTTVEEGPLVGSLTKSVPLVGSLSKSVPLFGSLSMNVHLFEARDVNPNLKKKVSWK